MFELARQLEPAVVAGVDVQVDEDLVHAAELGIHHVFEFGFAEVGQHGFRPFREADLDVQRRPVSCMAPGIAKAAERLVKRVPRRP